VPASKRSKQKESKLLKILRKLTVLTPGELQTTLYARGRKKKTVLMDKPLIRCFARRGDEHVYLYIFSLFVVSYCILADNFVLIEVLSNPLFLDGLSEVFGSNSPVISIFFESAYPSVSLVLEISVSKSSLTGSRFSPNLSWEFL
jgi:hypothetical protein